MKKLSIVLISPVIYFFLNADYCNSMNNINVELFQKTGTKQQISVMIQIDEIDSDIDSYSPTSLYEQKKARGIKKQQRKLIQKNIEYKREKQEEKYDRKQARYEKKQARRERKLSILQEREEETQVRQNFFPPTANIVNVNIVNILTSANSPLPAEASSIAMQQVDFLATCSAPVSCAKDTLCDLPNSNNIPITSGAKRLVGMKLMESLVSEDLKNFKKPRTRKDQKALTVRTFCKRIDSLHQTSLADQLNTLFPNTFVLDVFVGKTSVGDASVKPMQGSWKFPLTPIWPMLADIFDTMYESKRKLRSLLGVNIERKYRLKINGIRKKISGQEKKIRKLLGKEFIDIADIFRLIYE
ncbi:MAG: hypothetical protein LBT67_01825 [Holosporaceae bacterium]|jgi:hypothetical protein|nr:hypothetical protein [Holosporaceae bacterium]